MNVKTALFAAAIVAVLPTMTYAQTRDQNRETICQATGSGMDPRCVGDTTAGTVSDFTTANQEEYLDRNATRPVDAPVRGYGNRYER